MLAALVPFVGELLVFEGLSLTDEPVDRRLLIGAAGERGPVFNEVNACCLLEKDFDGDKLAAERFVDFGGKVIDKGSSN